MGEQTEQTKQLTEDQENLLEIRETMLWAVKFLMSFGLAMIIALVDMPGWIVLAKFPLLVLFFFGVKGL